MDSPAINGIFRQLCQRRARNCLHAAAHPPFRIPLLLPRSQRRRLSRYRGRGATEADAKWYLRPTVPSQDQIDDYKWFPMVTARDLQRRQERPRRVKMLLRDFIEDSLYNPQYGYFTKQAVIFSAGEPFAFNQMANEDEFRRQLSGRYIEFEDRLDAKTPNPTRQLWHTPTELFRPYYGDAIARYLVSNYKLTLYPYHDLIIYELGAGNGTMMLNILDYIHATDPDVYARTHFRVIEISSALAALQQRTWHQTRTHRDKIRIINRSVFHWDAYVPSPCFILALEVFDNFPHDSISYDAVTGEACQSVVLIDAHGDLFEFHEPALDPVAARFLRGRDAACPAASPHPLRYSSSRLRHLVRSLRPLTPALSEPEYIPTRLMNFFDILREYFPAHRLVTSDFHRLPDAIRGVNAPVVQTRFERRTVPVSTPLVLQGYFDILFPTHFPVIEAIYRAITGKLTRVLSHEEFLRRWACVDETRTASGENPMLSWYKNASVMTTL
ncbi:MAG: hypothetical protein M1826_003486 [Phylliscum demangeonii]|nr:MAG: hypothetical protein M1826_003486 [Phylliscum demangeonii]